MSLFSFQRLGYAPATLIPRLVSFAFVILFTRVLSAEQFGLYALAILYAEFLDSVCLNWGRLGVLRFHAVRTDGRTPLAGAICLQLAGAMVGCAAVTLWCLIGDSLDSRFAGWLIVYFLATGLLRFLLNLLRADGRRASYVAAEVLRPILGLAVAWMLAAGTPSFVSLLAGMSVATFAAFAWLLVAHWRHISIARESREIFAESLAYSAPLVLVFLASQSIVIIDRVMIGAISGPAAVGVYAAAFALARPFVDTVFNIINLDAYPRLVQAYEREGPSAARSLLVDVLSDALFFSAPVVVVLLMLAGPIAEAVLPVEYNRDAPWIIRLVAIAALAACLKSFVFDQTFHLVQKSLAQSATLVPAAILGVGASLVLIPAWGAVGGAIAAVLGAVTASTLSFFWSRRYLRINPDWRALLAVGGASLALAGCLRVLEPLLVGPFRLMSIVPGAVVYLAVHFVIANGNGLARFWRRRPA